jgi:cytochrome c-type biogenesis protein CcmH/NrfG
MGMTEFLLVVAVGGGIIAVLTATFRGAAADATGQDRTGEVDTAAQGDSARRELEDRRLAAIRSLEEIEADFETGNLSEADYQTLKRRYQKEVETLDQRLEATAPAAVRAESGQPQTAPARSGSWMSMLGWIAGAVAFVALAWLVMSQTLRPRSEGDTITGSLPGQTQGMPSGAPVADVDMERLAELRRIVAEDPDNVDALVELGHMYLTLQSYPELSDVTQRALMIDPDNPEALTHLGMLLFSSGHPQGVMESFDRALQVDPNFGEALQFKGMVAFIRRDYETAVEAWQRYLDVVPPDEVSPRIRGMLESARANLGSAAAQESETEGQGGGG